MKEDNPDRADVVIVGGGFAGAATACFLARRGVTDLLVLESADQFGAAASTGTNGFLRCRACVPNFAPASCSGRYAGRLPIDDVVDER